MGRAVFQLVKKYCGALPQVFYFLSNCIFLFNETFSFLRGEKKTSVREPRCSARVPKRPNSAQADPHSVVELGFTSARLLPARRTQVAFLIFEKHNMGVIGISKLCEHFSFPWKIRLSTDHLSFSTGTYEKQRPSALSFPVTRCDRLFSLLRFHLFPQLFYIFYVFFHLHLSDSTEIFSKKVLRTKPNPRFLSAKFHILASFLSHHCR